MIFLTTALLALTVHGLPSDGAWQGLLVRGRSQLEVCVVLDAQRASGTFSAPDLGAIGVPLRAVRTGTAAHFELAGDRTTTRFDGRVAGDVMRGTFAEDGARNGTFLLHRVASAEAKPYDEQRVTFGDRDVRLSGTVYVPRRGGPHPAAVLVHGSGPEGRWAMAYVADALARQGVVALAYDKRGVGESTGDWRTATLQDLARDARAGVHLLAQRADVDPSRLGVYGHSQGAEIAPEIARENPEVRWVVAADGPVGPQYRQDLFRVDTLLAKRYAGPELVQAERLYAEFVDVARTGAPHERLRADMVKAAGAPWLAALAIPDDDSWIWRWYAAVGNYDNSGAWAAVKVPVMLLFGQNDELVPPERSIAETTRLLNEHGNRAVTVRIFPGADHTLHVPPADADGWPHNAPGFPAALAEFARRPNAGS